MGKSKFDSRGKEFNAETLALGFGYDPFLSEGSVKPPAFLTSTFQFKCAEDGKKFFELAYGLREPEQNEAMGLIYSRLNNPNLQIFEERIAAWDKTEKGAVFASGMAAISTTVFALLSPGDVIISSAPVYGGTHYLFENILPKFNIKVIQVIGGNDTPQLMREAAKTVQKSKIKMLYLETPANPSNIHIDIRKVAEVAKELSTKTNKVITAVDNTFLGPVFQRPAPLGADLVIYSATKFIGGHSDLIAGVVTGPAELMNKISEYRIITGTMATPFSGWLLLRSLETLSIRMRRQAKTAQKLAKLLLEHPKVENVNYPGLLKVGDPQYDIASRQCTGHGALIAFDIKGGEKEAFKVLNSFKLFRLAVSLGGTESLVEHPMSMTHSDVPPAELEKYSVGAGMIRMSVGIEHLSDLKRDLNNALNTI
jgi:methionine-gamma-lyase